MMEKRVAAVGADLQQCAAYQDGAEQNGHNQIDPLGVRIF